MQTALITTTVNVPTVLALYRKLGPDVAFFVAGDLKTPTKAAMGSDAPHYMNARYQQLLGYKCSELLGWSNDSRRNIALLEAVKWGADIIVSIDDDMIPTDIDFFERIEMTLSEPYSGLQMGTPDRWFDAGQFTNPPVRQRGLPYVSSYDATYGMALDVQVGVMQGIILGVPDTDAQTMVARYLVKSATDILRKGFVVDPVAKAVFNSQITAFRRELAPCFAQFYNWQGRNTDILASLVMRRVMQERDLYTHFGPPTGFHNRSKRDHLKDMAAEAYGVGIVQKFSEILDNIILPTGSVVEQTRAIYQILAHNDCFPALEVANSFLDDIEPLL